MSGAPCFHVPFTEENVRWPNDPYKDVVLVGILIGMQAGKVKFVRFSELLKRLGTDTA